MNSFFKKPFAHRGLHNSAQRRVENSHAAFAAALAHGYGIELDTQMTADGVAIVFHDESMERLTSLTNLVSNYKIENLTSVHLKNSDDTIETLAQCLAFIGNRTEVLVEIKTTHTQDRQTKKAYVHHIAI